MRCLTPIAVFIVLLPGSNVFAQTPQNVVALIDQSIANAEQNATAALAYTFHENYLGKTNTAMPETQYGAVRLSAGSPTVAAVRPDTNSSSGDSESSVQYDVLFIKGVPYRRVLSVNHKPLSPEAAAAESKRYDAAVASIYAMSDEQRMSMTKGGKSLMVDPKQLTSLYDCNIVGHEKIQKRSATVVECKLRHDLPAQSDGAADPISADIKIWIDDEKPFFVRTRAVLNRTVDQGRKLTVLTIQWRLMDDVWHQTSTEVDWVGPALSQTKGKVIDSFSDFKRFRSEVTVLPGYMPDMPLPEQQP